MAAQYTRSLSRAPPLSAQRPQAEVIGSPQEFPEWLRGGFPASCVGHRDRDLCPRPWKRASNPRLPPPARGRTWPGRPVPCRVADCGPRAPGRREGQGPRARCRCSRERGGRRGPVARVPRLRPPLPWSARGSEGGGCECNDAGRPPGRSFRLVPRTRPHAGPAPKSRLPPSGALWGKDAGMATGLSWGSRPGVTPASRRGLGLGSGT